MSGSLVKETGGNFQTFNDPYGNLLIALRRDGFIQFSDGSTIGAGGRSGSYLPLAGGTLTGTLVSSVYDGNPVYQFNDDDGLVSYTSHTNSFSNAPNDARLNQVHRFGWNMGGGGRFNVAEPAMGIEMEDYYAPDGTNRVMEFHCVYYGTSGSVVRVFDYQANRGTDFVVASIAADSFYIAPRATPSQQNILFDVQNNALSFLHSCALSGENSVPAQSWSITGATGSASFTGSLMVGTSGVTSAFSVTGLSTQGPNLLALNNEHGLVFSVAPTGGTTFTADANFGTAHIIFGATQSVRLGDGSLAFNSSTNLGWSSDTHAYDALDTNVSRSAAGVVAIGTGAQGSVAGTLACATVKFSTALVALGGGASATLGTIGGSGPAAAAQNTWLLLKDSTGASFWVPAWK